MAFPKLPTSYDAGVVEELIKFYRPERVQLEPILQALDNTKLWTIRQKFSRTEIIESFRRLALELHPDRNLDKTLEKQRRCALYFGKVVETYRSLVDLQRPSEIPFAMTFQYRELESESYRSEPETVLECIFPIPIWYITAEIRKMIRDSKYSSTEGYLNNPTTIVKDPTELEMIKAFIEDEKNGTANEDLEDVEYALHYGFYYYYFEDYIPHCPHKVAIKHLERANAFDAPPNEWVIIDKHLVIEVGYIEGSEKEEIKFGLPIKHIPHDKIRHLVSIEPSTVTMMTKKGGMFVVRNPYHKFLMPKDDVLVPIEKYVDAKTTEIVPVDTRDLPITTEEGKFIHLHDRFERAYGEQRLPWTHLSPRSVKILRDWPLKSLERPREQLPYK